MSADAATGGIDAQTLHSQRIATDPEGSAWVSANAGSGKTFVLSRRVIRLLLAGVEPGRILCLTFTKAAAAEMARRVFGELGRWTTLSDDALREALAELSDRPPDEATLAHARRLFAAALETPGGLEDPDDPCLLRAPPAPVSAGGEHRLELRDPGRARRRRAEGRGAARDAEGGRRRSRRCPRAGARRDRADGRATGRWRIASTSSLPSRDRFGAWIVANGDLDGAFANLRAELGANEPADAVRRELLAGVPFDRRRGRAADRAPARERHERPEGGGAAGALRRIRQRRCAPRRLAAIFS